MIKIDYKEFNENLLLTQAYCEKQLKSESADPASIFRSFNPIYDGKPLFSFKWNVTVWALNPLGVRNELFYDLFKKQLAHKREVIDISKPRHESKGRILVAEIDMTHVDGASEAQSEGLIDVNDWPPIDTWFYHSMKGQFRLLFAWIPEPYVELANNGIDVNVVDCMYWYNEDSDFYHIEKSGRSQPIQKPMGQAYNFWSRIKALFSR